MKQGILGDGMRTAFALLLLAGCCNTDPPAARHEPRADSDLERVREGLSGPQRLRVRFRGEWPHAVATMPRTVNGTILLGDGQRAKISMTVSTAFGKDTRFDAVCDGTTLWRSPSVEARRYNPGPSGLRVELLYGLSWHGLGWSFPHGTHPNTIGEGYVVLDMVPKVPDTSPPWKERADATACIVNYASPGVDYRIRLSVDPTTRQIRKRDLIGDKGDVWYSESYEVEANAAIPDDEFKLPG
jgi:hypothetical protein